MANTQIIKLKPKIDTDVSRYERRFSDRSTHYVLLFRRILDNDQFRRASTVGKLLYITCIIMANYRVVEFKTVTWRGQNIEVHLNRGQSLTSHKQMCEILNGLPPRTIKKSGVSKKDIEKLIRNYHKKSKNNTARGYVSKAHIVSVLDVRWAFTDIRSCGLIKTIAYPYGTVVTVLWIFNLAGSRQRQGHDRFTRANASLVINKMMEWAMRAD